ncbi:AzlD domain-containing protein [Miniphocaeibacter halophilus]|uniref:AzlD domain-containing protein n=1 Tax=Miniphocaeibacter halophilus TaxID=2931922 RepID=A0AC61MX09_9FIRM|nr:AzlD domain-containing protein [Miniphocaeibacter halophilus]QQK08058.1 AzlD domain-containing protein [Miniphocaeibacter halophilus]
MNNLYIYILVMAIVTYLIRAIPLTLIRKEINNKFIKSFLYYVPYVTLSVLIFPAILYSTSSIISAIIVFIIAIILSYRKLNMMTVAIISCLTVFIIEYLLL